MPEKRQLPAHQIRAAIKPDSLNAENRTVDLTWSTGYKGLRQGWSGKFYEELSMKKEHVNMSRLNGGAPLLDSHDSYSTKGVIGVVERAQLLENGQGIATVRFGKDEESDKVFKKVQDGILRNVSVGYNVAKYEDVTGPEETVKTYRAIDWTPMELSIVPVGFDPMAQVRNQEQTTHEVEIIETRAITKKEAEMPQDNQPVKQPEVVDTEALKKEAIEAERKRSADIRKAVKEAKLSDSLADDMINRGLPYDEAQRNVQAFKLALEEDTKTAINHTVKVEVGLDEKDKKREAAIDAILHRTDSKIWTPKDGNPFVNQSLLRVMEAFQDRKSGMSDGSFATRVMSSSDLPYILSNVAEKSAQKKYQLQPRTWSRWARTDTLRNYKTADKVRSGDFASLEERQENGEFKRGSFGEEREQVTLKDWGKILSFTRRMLINDDLDEISKVTSQAGVAASRLENRLVYEQLTSNPTMGDSVALFHATHANLGTGAAISDTTIGEAFQLMREQETVDGEDKLNLAPQYMLVGPQSEVIARKYLAQISPTQATNVNVFSGSLELIVDSEISDNDYFFACNPDLCPTVVLYHLQGEEQPRVESRIDFETESLEIKCAHAAVAKALDFRGLVKNPNAS